jgi:RNA polymerase sigma-70 factor (family 1)
LIDSDDQIVKAIRENNHEAFKNLFDKYYKPLVRFCWYRIYSMEISQDLVQELFFKIWVHRKRLDPDRSIKAYLYRSLTNAIINHTKLSSTHSSSLDNIDEGKYTSEQNNLEEKLDIQNAISKLPEKLKNVYLLSRVDGYNYKEIAELCNITVKAVEKRMSKAFIILRKCFSKNN